MFWSLFLTIVAPLVFALFVKRAAPQVIERHTTFFRELSVLAFGLLVTGITANSASTSALTLTSYDLIIMAGATLWLGFFTWLAYDIIPWRKPPERITIALCMVYLNNTLALFIGDKFFPDQNVLPKLILLLVVVNALLPPLKYVAQRITRQRPVPSPT